MVCRGIWETLKQSLTTAAPPPIVDHKASLAISYWRDPPTGIKEILIGGPVKIIRAVA
jgi:hypothetical protein